MRRSADKGCPPIEEMKKKEPWEDEELIQLVREMKKCKDSKGVKLYQKKIKERRKRLKNEYFKNLADNINTAAEARQIDKEFTLAKKYSCLKTGETNAVSKSKLKVHFEGHFAERQLELPEELQHPQKFPHLIDKKFDIKQGEPDEAEVELAISSFKNNRSAGTDKLKTECLKYNSSNTLIACIVLLMSLIWSTLKVPG